MDEPRRFIQVILGPRQVGKTTLVKQIIDESTSPCHYCSADSIHPAGVNWMEEQWEVARLKTKPANGTPSILVIDEIQKIHNWSETVKREWDRDSFNNIPVKLILLGSAQLLLEKGLSESLAGRFEVIRLPHWSFLEMNEAFDFTEEQYAWFGSYPGAAGLISEEKRWKDYIIHSLVETTVSKDIFQLSRIDKPALLKRVFELACLYSGRILSYNKMLGQLQDAGNTTTLSHYLNLLDSAGLISGLEKLFAEPLRQKGSSPKLQVQNMALMSSIHEQTFEQALQNPALWGRFAESAIGAHLINHAKEGGFDLHYWRERNDEVDFVIRKNGKIIGIEVKTGYRGTKSGMAAFKQRFHPYKMILVSNDAISWKEFLHINPLDLF